MSGATESAATSPAQGRLLDALLARIGERVAAGPGRAGPGVRPRIRPAHPCRTSPSDSTPRSCSARSWACSSSPTAAASSRSPSACSTRLSPSDGYTTVGSVVETNSEDSPFLVDSVSEELGARGLEIRLVVHPVIGTERDAEGGIAAGAATRARRRSASRSCTSRSAATCRRSSFAELEARIRVVLVRRPGRGTRLQGHDRPGARDGRGRPRGTAPLRSATRSRRRELFLVVAARRQLRLPRLPRVRARRTAC